MHSSILHCSPPVGSLPVESESPLVVSLLVESESPLVVSLLVPVELISPAVDGSPPSWHASAGIPARSTRVRDEHEPGCMSVSW